MRLLWLSFVLALSSLACAQPPDTLWTRTIGGTEDDGFQSIQCTHDGGFIVAGVTGSYGAGGSDAYLVRTNLAGDTTWTRTYGGTRDDGFSSVIEDSDQQFLCVGTTESFGAGTRDIYVVKTDSIGNLVWQRTFGGAGIDVGRSVCQTSDLGYVIVGSTLTGTSSGLDMFVARLDVEGDTVWTRTLGSDVVSRDEALDVLITSSGNVAIAGYTQLGVPIRARSYVVCMNLGGAVLWEDTSMANVVPLAFSMARAPNSSFVVAGTVQGINQPQSVFLLRLGNDGSVQDSSIYDGASSFSAYSIRAVTNGGFVVTGSVEQSTIGQPCCAVLRVDLSLHAMWFREYCGTGASHAYAMCIAADGGFTLAGTTMRTPSSDLDGYIVKTGEESSITIRNRFQQTAVLLESYPNPFNSTTTITLNMPLSARNVTLTTFNLLGQVVREDRLPAAVGQISYHYDAAGLASGIYLLRAEAGAVAQTMKLVVMK